MRTGEAFLPLHDGKAPRWLFDRMKKLSALLIEAMIELYGTEELLRRLSDPFWFQSFGCLLGFDWHSSGLTTTLCGAMKEGLRGREKFLGFFIAGGKASRALKTPEEIARWSDIVGLNGDALILASRLTAKIDNSALQDGYTLYHHVVFFDARGNWSIVQQGMNAVVGYARRYHWLSFSAKDFVNDPHSGIASPVRHRKVLNLVSSESASNREAILNLLVNASSSEIKRLFMQENHMVSHVEVDAKRFLRKFEELKGMEFREFRDLLLLKGVGAKTLRALSLTAEVLTGRAPSYKDPVRYTYAHGGKDGHPFPVDRETYDRTISILENIVRRAELSRGDKERMLRKLTLISS